MIKITLQRQRNYCLINHYTKLTSVFNIATTPLHTRNRSIVTGV